MGGFGKHWACQKVPLVQGKEANRHLEYGSLVSIRQSAMTRARTAYVNDNVCATVGPFDKFALGLNVVTSYECRRDKVDIIA